MPSVDVIPARSEDLAAIAALIVPYVERKQLLPRTNEELAALIPNAFVAVSDREVVGCAAVEIYSPKLAEIISLAVREDFQGQGIGVRLVAECIELARRKGAMELMAVTLSESLFRRCGFDYTLPDQKRALFINLRGRS